jgi:hypothetical protein
MEGLRLVLAQIGVVIQLPCTARSGGSCFGMRTTLTPILDYDDSSSAARTGCGLATA